MEFDLSDWGTMCLAFSEMFEGLGDVSTSEDTLSYSSYPHDVTTGITITSDGSIIANMPLHNITSKFDRIQIDSSMHCIRLIGPSLDYTYTIPPNIKRITKK